MTRPNDANAVTLDPAAAALTLMQEVLREGRPLAQEYPLVFGPDDVASGTIEIIEQGGRIVSTCAWLPRQLMTPSADVPVALVGSVATDAECRGKGLGTQVVEHACANAAAGGAALSLLWADDPAWYQERGWIPFGSETIFVVDDTMAFLLPEPDGVRPAAEGDVEAIHDLYCLGDARVRRTLAETRALLGVPGMDVVVRAKDGKVTGYACMGRGEDLQNVIHEWSGTPEDVLPCVSLLWRASKAERLFFMTPEVAVDFRCYFEFVKARGATGILCMAKLGNVEAMANVFDQATPADVEVTADGDDALVLKSPRGAIRLQNEEILLALCPPRGDRRVTDVVETDLVTPLEGLPIQPFIWGLDSI